MLVAESRQGIDDAICQSRTPNAEFQGIIPRGYPQVSIFGQESCLLRGKRGSRERRGGGVVCTKDICPTERDGNFAHSQAFQASQHEPASRATSVERKNMVSQ